MGQVTAAGYLPERLADILVKLDAGFRTIYGDDINTDPDTPDGQMIGLIAQIKADMEELGEAIYRALDPDHASGAWLEQRVAYAGLLRRTASYSYLRRVQLSGTEGALIAAGSIVEDESKQRWLLVSDAVLGPAGARGDFRSAEMGGFDLQPGATLAILTKAIGWAGATTTETAEVGADEELDTQLRQRFFLSRARGAQNAVDGIEANLLQLPDVRESICLENFTDTIDANGLPPHSINVVVDGGQSAEIARVIFERKTAGTGMAGAVEVAHVDSRGRTRPIRFDRPTAVDCAAYIEVQRDEGYTAVDVEAIKQAVAGLRFKIGQDVQRTRLYSPINTVPGFWVQALTIGRVGQPLTAGNVPIGVREKARFAAADIEVIVL